MISDAIESLPPLRPPTTHSSRTRCCGGSASATLLKKSSSSAVIGMAKAPLRMERQLIQVSPGNHSAKTPSMQSIMVPSSVLPFFAIGSFLLFAFALAPLPPAQRLRDQRHQFFLGAAEHVFVTDQLVAEPAVVSLRFEQLVLEAFDDDLQLGDPKDRGQDDLLLGDRLVGLVIELLGVGLVQRPDSAASGGT